MRTQDLGFRDPRTQYLGPKTQNRPENFRKKPQLEPKHPIIIMNEKYVKGYTLHYYIYL